MTEISQKADTVKFTLYGKAKLDVAKIPEFIASYGNNLKITMMPKHRILLIFEEKFQGKECGCQSCDRRFFKWCEGKLKDCAGLCEKRVKNLAAPVKKHYNRKSDYPCIKIEWIHLGG